DPLKPKPFLGTLSPDRQSCRVGWAGNRSSPVDRELAAWFISLGLVERLVLAVAPLPGSGDGEELASVSFEDLCSGSGASPRPLRVRVRVRRS
ncbi:MAG: hypothetical protein ACYTFG_00005, partial [Planctomycetota bacterium]